MNSQTLNETIALGAVTGMRSFAGPAALAMRHGGILKGIVPLIEDAVVVGICACCVPRAHAGGS